MTYTSPNKDIGMWKKPNSPTKDRSIESMLNKRMHYILYPITCPIKFYQQTLN